MMDVVHSLWDEILELPDDEQDEILAAFDKIEEDPSIGEWLGYPHQPTWMSYPSQRFLVTYLIQSGGVIFIDVNRAPSREEIRRALQGLI